MAKRPIVSLPSSVLRKKAEAVPAVEILGPRIQRLIADMRDTLAATPDGVGLAAPQVGARVRAFLVSEEARYSDRGAPAPDTRPRRDTSKADAGRRWEYFAFINPVLKKQSRKKNEAPEGCLSVPGKYGLVWRAEKVSLEWCDEFGKKHERGFSKFFARVIQHELDHLEGVLIVDRARRLVTVPSEGE